MFKNSNFKTAVLNFVYLYLKLLLLVVVFRSRSVIFVCPIHVHGFGQAK